MNASLDNAAIRSALRGALAAGPGLAARKDGEPAKALADAKKTLSALYELPMLAHATMEPMNCTADVKADSCDLYVGTQVQKISQVTAAKAAGLAPEKIRVFTTLLGCGLGRRLEVDFVPAAVAASKAVGAPVKLIWTREDDMTAGYYRPPAALRVSGGFDAAGKLSAWQLHIASPSITQRYTTLPGAPQVTDPFDSVTEAAVTFPYAVPNVGVNFTRKEIGITVAYVRSVSHAINCFAIESFMDELAGAAGADPYEFRRALLAQKPRHKRVLETVAERAGWGRVPQGQFQGIALMEGYTTCIAQVAEISVQGGQIKVHKIVCALDCGQTVNPKDPRVADPERYRFRALVRAVGRRDHRGRRPCSRRISITTGYCAATRCRRSMFTSSRATSRQAASARSPYRWWRPRSATRSSQPPANVCGHCRSPRTAVSRAKNSSTASRC